MFREAVLRCPSCEDIILRPLAARLICDRCHGFFLGHADLEQVLQDLSGLAITLEFFDKDAGARSCPRYANVMSQCKLRVVLPGLSTSTKHPLDRCLADGVWFDTDELEDVMARMHRELTHRSSR